MVKDTIKQLLNRLIELTKEGKLTWQIGRDECYEGFQKLKPKTHICNEVNLKLTKGNGIFFLLNDKKTIYIDCGIAELKELYIRLDDIIVINNDICDNIKELNSELDKIK